MTITTRSNGQEITADTIWLKHEGYPNYLFSPEGNVLSLYTGEIKKLSNHSRGYICSSFRTKNKTGSKLIHRIIAEIYCENKHNKKQVNHIDGNKKNNNYKNLEWVTNQENRDHAVKNGLHSHGEDHPNAKIDTKMVNKIVSLLTSGNSITKISKMLNVSRYTINSISLGKGWKNTSKLKRGDITPYAARGENCGSSKLKEIEVIEIKKILAIESARSIARKYGVNKGTILSIKHGKTWKGVE